MENFEDIPQPTSKNQQRKIEDLEHQWKELHDELLLQEFDNSEEDPLEDFRDQGNSIHERTWDDLYSQDERDDQEYSSEPIPEHYEAAELSPHDVKKTDDRITDNILKGLNGNKKIFNYLMKAKRDREVRQSHANERNKKPWE